MQAIVDLESCKQYTPKPLALAMVKALGSKPNNFNWLEPCLGEGVFLEALDQNKVPPNKITAIDIDKKPRRNDRLASTLRNTDFIEWAAKTPLQFERIICNPPYLEIRKQTNIYKKTVIALLNKNEIQITERTNFWYVFLKLTLKLLKKNGSLAFVLPASWEYAQYAESLRQNIPLLFESFSQFRCNKPLFPNVQDGCIIIICKNYGVTNKESSYNNFNTPSDLIFALNSHRRQFKPSIVKKKTTSKKYSRNIRKSFGDVFEIGQGGVTGDSNYFLMNESKRRELGLPQAAMRPVVSKANQLIASEINIDIWKQLKATDQRVWLFQPTEKLTKHPKVKEYLQLVQEEGGCDKSRYKIQNRAPWYITPLPKNFHGFLSGMSPRGPWISYKGYPLLSATNTLYIIRIKNKIELERKYAWGLSLLTSFTREQLPRIRRIYPEGLHKYEPSDLYRIEMLEPTKKKDAKKDYILAINCLLSGNETKAMNIADSYFS